jgi:hypothetical protein
MGDYDRKLYRTSWKGGEAHAEVPVHGNIEIDKGDLLFLDRVDGLRTKGASSADWYAYPFSKLSGTTRTLASNRELAAKHFLGVALWHSDSGVTETIGVHLQGLFKYPLKNARHTKVGYHVIPAGSGVTLYNQKLAVTSSSSDRIGLVAKGGTFQSAVEVVIWSIFNIAQSEAIRDTY